MRGSVYSLALPLLLAGCASAAPAASKAGGTDLCQQVRAWKASGDYARRQVAPSGSDEGGLNYRFDLAGRHGLKSVSAECGAGSYSECQFAVERADGGRYAFTELSRFGLILVEDRYYLVYGIVGASKGRDPHAQRVVELSDPPKPVCDQIGDYADLM
ncbi:hypothetical protein LVB77_02560 [Lysobacter sp. 5GHs7-4]|uniref:hypothetical protein n=1 Tax=Lysobacter sp. 5GHs7-4 TaxID=2904253 RepID=UPI001E4DF840|nr:hypothetical protein [Lysobacter sp. 5GHs7-4]UHQ23618.1 hypothetical protein LVB77_02560 [Lysobacter sp. 5GHs7-4]